MKKKTISTNNLKLKNHSQQEELDKPLSEKELNFENRTQKLSFLQWLTKTHFIKPNFYHQNHEYIKESSLPKKFKAKEKEISEQQNKNKNPSKSKLGVGILPEEDKTPAN